MADATCAAGYLVRENVPVYKLDALQRVSDPGLALLSLPNLRAILQQLGPALHPPG